MLNNVFTVKFVTQPPPPSPPPSPHCTPNPVTSFQENTCAEQSSLCVCVCMYMYIYIYETEREGGGRNYGLNAVFRIKTHSACVFQNKRVLSLRTGN